MYHINLITKQGSQMAFFPNFVHISCKMTPKLFKTKPILLCGVNKPEISQGLILSHITTVLTNQNTGNSQIL